MNKFTFNFSIWTVNAALFNLFLAAQTAVLMVICNLYFCKSFCRPRIKIPVFVMMPIAHMVEWAYKLFGRYGMSVPQLIPSRIRLLSCSRTFNSSKAKDQLGYTPIVTLQVI